MIHCTLEGLSKICKVGSTLKKISVITHFSRLKKNMKISIDAEKPLMKFKTHS